MEQQDILYDASEYIETVRLLILLSYLSLYSIALFAFPLSTIMCALQASGNKVSRTCVLCGSKNIVLNGKVLSVIHVRYTPYSSVFPYLKTVVQSACIIRGDLANINIGRQCVIGKRSVITPPFKKLSHGYI